MRMIQMTFNKQGKSSIVTPCIAYLLTKEVEFTFFHLKNIWLHNKLENM